MNMRTVSLLACVTMAFPAIDTPLSQRFDVWYHLPSLRKEAVITVTFSFEDDDGVIFQKSVDITVAP